MTGTILLLGGSGQVGTALRKLHGRVLAPSHKQFDLSTATLEATRRLVSTAEPDAVINCAGYTDVDRAEAEANVAGTVNGTAVGLLSAVTAEHDIPFVTFSTDYVFDGNSMQPYVESSPTSPLNAYGRSKLTGERLVLENCRRGLVIRTSWVISGTHPNFVATILRNARESHPLRVVDDQVGCPTIADDLAAATIQGLEAGATGLLHLANAGTATWFELASAALREADLLSDVLSPCTTSEYPTSARRPAYSVLGSERIEGFGLTPLPPWQKSLSAVVRALTLQ